MNKLAGGDILFKELKYFKVLLSIFFFLLSRVIMKKSLSYEVAILFVTVIIKLCSKANEINERVLFTLLLPEIDGKPG